jgi:hypothetical protein
MQELIKFRNFKEWDCATVVEHYRVLPPLPSPRFAPHYVLLGYAVTTGCATVRKDHVTSVTCATVHNAAFSACQTPAFIRENEGSAEQYRTEWQHRVNSRVNWEVSWSSSVRSSYKFVKWIIVARPRKGQINKALNKHSTSYSSCY